MRQFKSRAIASVFGAIALATVGAGSAAAADIPVPEGQPRYSAPQVQEEYVYRRPPVVYRYAAPPPVVHYNYAPSIVVPGPYPYYRRHIVRGYVPYRYRHAWVRGHHRW